MKDDDFTHKLLESALGKPTTDADKKAREILERMFDMVHEQAPGVPHSPFLECRLTRSFPVVFIIVLAVFIAILLGLYVVWVW